MATKYIFVKSVKVILLKQKNMKLKTIHNYIKYSDKPYTDIIDKAKKSKDLEVITTINKDIINYVIKDKIGLQIELNFNKDDINDGCIIGFSPF